MDSSNFDPFNVKDGPWNDLENIVGKQWKDCDNIVKISYKHIGLNENFANVYRGT